MQNYLLRSATGRDRDRIAAIWYAGVLAELFVWPDQTGKGIGTALLGYAKANMPGAFRLYTSSANIRARRFMCVKD